MLHLLLNTITIIITIIIIIIIIMLVADIRLSFHLSLLSHPLLLHAFVFFYSLLFVADGMYPQGLSLSAYSTSGNALLVRLRRHLLLHLTVL